MQLDAEKAHDLSINSLRLTQRTLLKSIYRQPLTRKPVEVFGLEFDNPLGIAAGLDKNGECIDAFAAMGFGFVEVGTVTPLAQPGNPKPRLFRLPQVLSIINRMGFNNKGVDYLVEQVKTARYKGVLGINIGKNKTTAEEDALNDYLTCLKKVYLHASYVVVNISSPNTPGLRNLQYGDALNTLLDGLKQAQHELNQLHNKSVPLLLKIAPDLDNQQLQSIAESINQYQLEGVIATNTTLDRESVSGLPNAQQTGGLSGAALSAKSLQINTQLQQYLDPSIPVIGVGGIHNASTAKEMLNTGAKLLQIYSGFIYKGPPLIKEILKAI
jgi:dihydroorotate dehydrogenase